MDGVDGVVLPPVLLFPDGFGGGGFVETIACAPVNVFFASAFILVCTWLAAAAAGLVFPPVVLAPPSDLFVFPS